MSTSKSLKYFAEAAWKGGLKGNGVIKSGGNTFKKGLPLEVPIIARTTHTEEGMKGDDNKTNPEELAVAAHSACYTMTLTGILGVHNITPKMLDTKGTLTLEKSADGFNIKSIHLACNGDVPNLDQQKFKEYAELANKKCPISKLFKCDITVDAKLV